MKRVFTSLILTGAVFAALSAVPQKAEAGTSIFFGFGAPAPVVYAQPRVVYAPQPVYYRPAPFYYAPVQEVVYRPGWDRRGWDRNHRYDHNRDWDRDHDRDHNHR